MMRFVIFWLALLCAAAAAQPARAEEGRLVIVGGGLADDNDAVFAAFLDALPAPDAPIAIIPAASGVPVQSAAAFAAQLERRGVAPARIRIIRLATEDDPSTSEDESGWRGHGEAAAEVMRLAGVGGIWFSGGDQARIMATLVRPDGSDTALLALIRQRHAAGAVIGGTSAGAAIMSRTMIRQGDPLSLLPGGGKTREPLEVGQGLGFLRRGLVDQHFGERARLIRLVAALRQTYSDDRIGLGIDEDTALVIAPGQKAARVVGRGRVTVIDARSASYTREPPLDVRRAALVALRDGETIDLATLGPPERAQASGAATGSTACIAAPSAPGQPRSESQLVAALAAGLRGEASATCLMAAGEQGLALRFYRPGWERQGRLLLDILPAAIRLELRQR